MAKRATAADAAASDAVIVDATMALAAERGWRSVSLAEVAERAGVPLGRLYERFPERGQILAALGVAADKAALASVDASVAGEAKVDRLFDLLMRRLDHLAPHRTGIAAVLDALPQDPAAALCGAPRMARSMRWMLEGAGVPVTGPVGVARTLLLCGIWLRILRIWSRDTSEDGSQAMAALDKMLKANARRLGL